MSKKASLLICLLLTFLISCHKTDKKNVGAQNLKLNLQMEPPTLDPRKGCDLISSTIQFMLFEGLTKMTFSSTTELGMAEKIDISEDKKTYIFHLREAKWSNGDPVTSYDFKQAWLDMLTPNFPSPSSHLLYSIKNAERAKKGECPLDEVGLYAPNPKTFIVELRYPAPYFLELTSFCVLSPVHKQTTQANEKWADKAGPQFINNGPFLLSEWKKGDKILLKKNPLYWECSKTHLDSITITLVDSEMTVMQMYEKGDLDMLGLPFSAIPLDSIPSLLKENLIQLQPIAGTTLCAFNLDRFPFNHPKLRKALTLAVDRKIMIKNITQLNETIATGCLPPLLKNGHNNDLFKDADIQSAQELFEEALQELSLKREDFRKYSLTFRFGEIHKKIAQTLQQQWLKALGIEFKLEQMDLKVFIDKLMKKNYDFALTGWVAQYNDALNILDLYKYRANPMNFSGWENPHYIKLLDAALSISNPAERLRIMEEAEKLLVSETPLIPLYHWNYAYMKKNHLRDVYISPIGSIHFNSAYLTDEPPARLNLASF